MRPYEDNDCEVINAHQNNASNATQLTQMSTQMSSQRNPKTSQEVIDVSKDIKRKNKKTTQTKTKISSNEEVETNFQQMLYDMKNDIKKYVQDCFQERDSKINTIEEAIVKFSDTKAEDQQTVKPNVMDRHLNVQCYYCNKIGHKANKCFVKLKDLTQKSRESRNNIDTNNNYYVKRPILCFSCGKTGHKAINCQSKRSNTLYRDRRFFRKDFQEFRGGTRRSNQNHIQFIPSTEQTEISVPPFAAPPGKRWVLQDNQNSWPGVLRRADLEVEN